MLNDKISNIIELIDCMGIEEKVSIINKIKTDLHKISPFKDEPVDLVLWEKQDNVHANDYNPNAVAPVEMKLLETSVLYDHFTQPIVTWPNNGRNEVVDGFHRNRVGKECEEIQKRIHGYLPIVKVNSDRQDKGDRMAATVRHNRARGKHKIDSMSDIVRELKRRCWTDKKIAKHLGMDPDEVLRLAQITGLADAFGDREFSEAWEAEVVREEVIK